MNELDEARRPRSWKMQSDGMAPTEEGNRTAGDLETWRVGPVIGNWRNDGPELIEPIVA